MLSGNVWKYDHVDEKAAVNRIRPTSGEVSVLKVYPEGCVQGTIKLIVVRFQVPNYENLQRISPLLLPSKHSMNPQLSYPDYLGP